VILGHRPVGHSWSISVTPGLFQCLSYIFLVRILNILPQVLYTQPLLKDSLRQFVYVVMRPVAQLYGQVVFVSYIVLLYFIL